MALSLEIPFSKELSSSKSLPEISAFFRNPDRAITNLFPGLESLSKTNGDKYRWQFSKLSYGGYELKLIFDTRFRWTDSSFEITPTSQGGHRLNATWSYLPSSTGTKVRLSMQVFLELPIPSLMKAVIQPVALAELTKLLETYAKNVGKTIA